MKENHKAMTGWVVGTFFYVSFLLRVDKTVQIWILEQIYKNILISFSIQEAWTHLTLPGHLKGE